MHNSGVYLDVQGTERPRPEAIAAIQFDLTEGFGNPSALANERGRRALGQLERAREAIAACVGATSDEVIFCSGATEANNLALNSLTEPDGVLIVSSIEHKSVLSPAHRLGANGATVEICPVDSMGVVDLDHLKRSLGRKKTVVSIMHANNEIGVIQPLSEVSRLCNEAGAILHVDAAQTVGKLPVNVAKLGADAMTLSAHKFGGPIGSGALIARGKAAGRISPQILGGDQEAGLRGGTTPVALVDGMAAALSVAVLELANYEARTRWLRSILIDGLSQLPGYFLNGDADKRLVCNFSGGFVGVDGRLLIRQVPDVHIATGSACTTGNATSHVLEALRAPLERQLATIRISLGWSTTENEIRYVVGRFQEVVPQLQRKAA